MLKPVSAINYRTLLNTSFEDGDTIELIKHPLEGEDEIVTVDIKAFNPSLGSFLVSFGQAWKVEPWVGSVLTMRITHKGMILGDTFGKIEDSWNYIDLTDRTTIELV